MAAPATTRIRDWMTAPETARVLAALTGGGADVRFVGGCVRDGILGREVRDVDIATPETPDRVTARLEAARIRVVPTGIDHGTVTAIVDHHPFEITTLREDVETYGRHARVEFTDDWRADAARRDFTMNAMSCRADGTLFDYFGGWDDLAAGRVRFVGDPATRILEDVLRLLRFYRFGAHYGRGAPDAAGRAACRALAPRLSDLSAERVRDETLRLLAAPAPAPTLDMMAEDGVLAAYLPEADGTAVVGALAAIEDALGMPSPVRRLAALLDSDADAAGTARRLKLSNADRDRLVAVHRGLPGFVPAADPSALRRVLYATGPETYADLLLLHAAARGQPAATVAAVLDATKSYTRPSLPVGGRDAQALGIADGPAMGALLKAVEEWWIAEDFRPDRAATLDRLRRLAARDRAEDPGRDTTTGG